LLSVVGTWLEILIIDGRWELPMPGTSDVNVKEIRVDLDKLKKQVNDLDAAINGQAAGLAQRITVLETKLAEMERTK
jgi:hypothetical protein